jgi:subtilase family serine protease
LWAMVTNDGPVATTSTTVLQITDTYDGHEAYRATTIIPILAPGASQGVELMITLNSGCGRNHDLVLRIDPSNSLPESFKLDNVSLRSHYVAPARPNLFVAYISVDWAHPVCGVAFNVTVRVSNHGSLIAGDSLLRLVDRVGTSELAVIIPSVPAIAAGASVGVLVHLTVMSHCGETHQIYVVIDYGNRVEEIHESDNTATKSYVLYS